jgi:FdhD protein
MTTSRIIDVQKVSPHETVPSARAIPVEAAVSIEVNGIGYAVMMATPADLEDFVTGFALSERIITCADEIEQIDVHPVPEGWIARMQVDPARSGSLLERVRTRASESSCGLCGLENLEQIARPLPPITVSLSLAPEALFTALNALRDHQPLNAETGGAHAAAFCTPTGTIQLVREDVGRHCAFDKLIGAMARAKIDAATGFFLLSSRCSYELVEKAVIARCPVLVTISTATSLAVERARAAGLTLYALARPDAALIMA